MKTNTQRFFNVQVFLFPVRLPIRPSIVTYIQFTLQTGFEPAQLMRINRAGSNTRCVHTTDAVVEVVSVH